MSDSNAEPSRRDQNAPAPPAGLGDPISGGLGSMPRQDLSKDKLLVNTPRVSIANAPAPSLGGIPLLAKLGQGGMGAVYYGIHPRLDIEVAVKVLPFEMAGLQPDLAQRFFREARVAAQVRSPHLVGVSDVNQEGGLYYIVMEFVRGQSAGALVREAREGRRPRLSEADALAIAIAACEGLCAAHAAGVIHRDIKPDNIMLPQRAQGGFEFSKAKLCDLGLARSEGMDKSLTGSFSAMGTPGYMAPEQGLDAKTAGKAADVFSMGATLYALLACHAPFHGSSVMKIMMDTAQQPHRPIRELRPDVSPETAALLDRCLRKDPAQRFADGETLLSELRKCTLFPVQLAETAPLQGESKLPPAAPEPSSFPSAPVVPQTPTPPAAQAGIGPGLPAPGGLTPAPSLAPPSQPPAPARKGGGAGLAVAATLIVLAGGGYLAWQQLQGTPGDPGPRPAPSDPAGRAQALESQASAEARLASWERTAERLRTSTQESGPAGAKVWKVLEGRSFGESKRTEMLKNLRFGKAMLDEGNAAKAAESFAAAEAVADAALPIAQQAEGLLEALAALETERASKILEKDAAFFAPVLAKDQAVTARIEAGELAVAETAAHEALAALAAARGAFEERAKMEAAREAVQGYEKIAALQTQWEPAVAIADLADSSAAAGEWGIAKEKYAQAAKAFGRVREFAGALAGEARQRAEALLAKGDYSAAESALQEAKALQPDDAAWTELAQHIEAARTKDAAAAHAKALQAAPQRLFKAEDKDLEAVVALLEEGAKGGDREAQAALGDAHLFARGVPRDYVKAREFFRKAAEAGHARSMHNLGELYLYGFGTPIDAAEGLRWFDKGRQSGDVACIFRAGQCRLAGFGAPKDAQLGEALVREALKAGLLEQAQDAPRLALLAGLYRFADYFSAQDPGQADSWFEKSAGHPRAATYRGFALRKDLDGAKQKQGVALLEEAAQSGDPLAMGELGFLYEKGIAVTRDLAKAVDWNRKAAELGNSNAMIGLGLMYANEVGVTRDFAKAAEWYRRAGEARNVAGFRHLAELHITGQGVTQSPARAAELFKQAFELGDARAAAVYGWRLLYGNGLAKDVDEGARWLQRAADAGDTGALVDLGNAYEAGLGVRQDYAKAMSLYEQAVAHGHSVAMHNLGMHYEYAKGVPQDFQKAAEWYRKAGEAGYGPGHRRLASLYVMGQGVAQSTALGSDLYKKAFDQDDALAAAEYGWRLLYGHGLPKNLNEAFHWIERAAKAGDAYGMRMLGVCHENGWGCAKDVALAGSWYRKGADGGDLYAAHYLANLYAAGNGLPRDLAQAAFWNRKAAEGGITEAMFSVGYAYGTGQGVALDYGAAVHWYEKAAANGHTIAMYNLGYLTYNGQGVTRDLTKAAQWYRQAAERGYTAAMYSLGQAYHFGNGVAQDYKLSWQWHEKAAQLDYAESMSVLGHLYANGHGVATDRNVAFQWALKGANKGSALGMYNVGVFYQNGWGVNQDLEQAVFWYRKASGLGYEGATDQLKKLGR